MDLDHNPKIWIILKKKGRICCNEGELLFGMILAGNILESKKTKI